MYTAALIREAKTTDKPLAFALSVAVRWALPLWVSLVIGRVIYEYFFAKVPFDGRFFLFVVVSLVFGLVVGFVHGLWHLKAAYDDDDGQVERKL